VAASRSSSDWPKASILSANWHSISFQAEITQVSGPCLLFVNGKNRHFDAVKAYILDWFAGPASFHHASRWPIEIDLCHILSEPPTFINLLSKLLLKAKMMSSNILGS
jgi:hypothetical protein